VGLKTKTPAKVRGGGPKPPMPTSEAADVREEQPVQKPATLLIASSSLTAANEGVLKGALKSLKGAKATKEGKENAASSGTARPFEGTHLVVGEPRRTMKVCAAIAAGAWVVGMAWVDASVAAGHWVDEAEYELGAAFPGAPLSREQKRDDAPATAQANARERLPLEGISVFVPPDSNVPRTALKVWLRSAGARALDSGDLAKQDARGSEGDPPSRRVLLAGKLFGRKARDEGVEVVGEKWALEAIATWSLPDLHAFQV